MVDHVSVGVTDVKRSKALYDAALAPLGMKPIYPREQGGQLVAIGYGTDPKPTFWLVLPLNGQPASAGNGMHIAFRAATREQVDAFFKAAIEQGGVDDGQPGMRPEYHAKYYGAFVRDFDGNKIEAVCHSA